MKSDIEIAQAAKLEKISSVADKLDIPQDSLEPYGHYKAKISMDFIKSLESKEDGKLILVTAISPTPAGEGKTTTSVGLGDALNHIGKKALVTIREPSLGPVFERKAEQLEEEWLKLYQWRILIFILPVTLMQSNLQIICLQLC